MYLLLSILVLITVLFFLAFRKYLRMILCGWLRWLIRSVLCCDVDGGK